MPLAMTLWFSFQRYNLLNPTIAGFAGIDNYEFLLTDPDFWVSLTNTLLLVGSVLVITVVGGTLLAVLFDQDFPGRGVARLLAIAPFFVMPTVSALIWKNLMMHPIYGVFGAGSPDRSACSRSTGSPSIPLTVGHHHRVLAVATLRAADPAHRHAVARPRADGGGAHGRGRADLHVLLHHPAALCARHLGRGHDRDDLPSDDLRRDLRHDFRRPGHATTNLAFLIYVRALLQYDVGGASAGGVIAIILANIVAFFLVRTIARNLELRRRAMESSNSEDLVIALLGWGAALLMFFPILWMLLTGFKTEAEAIATPPSLFFSPTLENYRRGARAGRLCHFALNSVVISVGATLAGAR